MSEFITGGGLAGEPELPASLATEGEAMAAALLGELAALPGLELVVTRDWRLPPPPGVETLVTGPGESLLGSLRQALPRCDLFWPLAPEEGGALETLVRLGLEAGIGTVACSPRAIALSGNKLSCSERLRGAGLPAVESRLLDDPAGPPPASDGWVVKPVDGAGCERTWFVPPDGDPACLAVEGVPHRYVAQPWIEGEPLSLSLLIGDGSVELLSVNRQRIARCGARIRQQGVEVAVAQADAGLARLAGRVATAIEGLRGYVGVDLQLTADGPVIIEVNPRLTSSYPALARCLERNLAADVIRATVPRVYDEIVSAMRSESGERDGG